MKIREIILKENEAGDVSFEEVKAVQDLLGTIDVTKERPETLLNKLTSWMTAHPALDIITNMIPQTRIVKAIAAAVNALEANDHKTALNALAGVVGGGLAQAARAVNVGSALQQGNIAVAALAAGGQPAKVAKAAGALGNIAQNDALGAVRQFSPAAANVAGAAQQYLKQQEPVKERR